MTYQITSRRHLPSSSSMTTVKDERVLFHYQYSSLKKIYNFKKNHPFPKLIFSNMCTVTFLLYCYYNNTTMCDSLASNSCYILTGAMSLPFFKSSLKTYFYVWLFPIILFYLLYCYFNTTLCDILASYSCYILTRAKSLRLIFTI